MPTSPQLKQVAKAHPRVHLHVVVNRPGSSRDDVPRINWRGALFVIIGRNTFSAAQNSATLLDRHTHAVFVGEPTGSRPSFGMGCSGAS